MDLEKLQVMKDARGFIAALDQSGGSSAKTLSAYGIAPESYSTEDEMFNLIHEMRKRVFTSSVFNNNRIVGAILFYKTMMGQVEDEFTADYLWNKKHIVSFLKVDKGLEEEANGVKLMKEIPDLDEQLAEANSKNVFGTKMRSVIYSANEEGIAAIVDQQFAFAKRICDAGLVPIIEPEVDINAPDKAECETILKQKIEEKLATWNENDLIMFKFTIPTEANKYLSLYDNKAVVKIVALSGGYDLDTACDLLSKNTNMIASFSRALLGGLTAQQSQEDFDATLDATITKIYNASID